MWTARFGFDSVGIFEDEDDELNSEEDQEVGSSIYNSGEDTYYRDDPFLPEIWDNW